MNLDQYNSWTKSIRSNPQRARLLVSFNRALTALGYIAFPALVIVQCVMGDWPFALRSVLAAGIGFLALSVFRAVVNAARPYEVLEIDPLIKKDTKGKSFPSRHTFSMFMIAFCWMAWCVPVGVVLTVSGCAIAVTRVLAGVHWPRDVIAALAFAVVCALVGFVLIP